MRYTAQLIVVFFILALSACGSDSPSTLTPGVGAYTLSWTVPTTRVNGDLLLLSEIKGYQVCYSVDGAAEQCYQFDVDDPSLSSYPLPEFSSGTYVLTLAIIDTDNIYSEKSQPLTYKIN